MVTNRKPKIQNFYLRSLNKLEKLKNYYFDSFRFILRQNRKLDTNTLAISLIRNTVIVINTVSTINSNIRLQKQKDMNIKMNI